MSGILHIAALAGYAALAAGIAYGLGTSHLYLPAHTAWGAGGALFLVLTLGHEVLSRRGRDRQFRRELNDARRLHREDFDDLRDAADALGRGLMLTRQDMERLHEVVLSASERGDGAVLREMKALQAQLGKLAAPARAALQSPEAADRTDLPSQEILPPDEATGPVRDAMRRPLPPMAEPPQDEAAMLEIVSDALAANRIDLWLQPIVSLPQRRTRFYEVFTRIRDGEGKVLLPEHYLPIAERKGKVGAIDNVLLFRAVQLLRRARQRQMLTGFFVNISTGSLADGDFMNQFADFLEANGNLSSGLIFELAQQDLEGCSAEVATALDRIATLGFRFSLDRARHLDFDAAWLGRHHFQFVKAPVELIIGEQGNEGLAIHPMDLKESLKRRDIDLIADRIETEAQVVEVLDYNVDFGQGYLFGQPRPSRDDI